MQGHIAHQVFDKLGILVGTLGHVLFVGALEKTPELTRGLRLHRANKIGGRHFCPRGNVGPNAHHRALIVGAVI